MKFATAYTMTSHCQSPVEIVKALKDVGLGRAAVADECRKIASAAGPRAGLYTQASAAMTLPKNLRRECNALGGA